uniref:Uncharacterized protein n=1 Tax=Helianthus annuus TaxID=4232 RepID=A0A251SFL6_HELAN
MFDLSVLISIFIYEMNVCEETMFFLYYSDHIIGKIEFTKNADGYVIGDGIKRHNG